jgi:histidine ammonia-lyase
MATTLVLDGQPICRTDVLDVAIRFRPVALGDEARRRMERGRAVVENALASGETVYGVTTAYGALKRVPLPAGQQAAFNRQTVIAHLVGSGAAAPEAVVRAAMLLRAQGFALGRSGVRPLVADAYTAALNARFHPPVRVVGSLGQSDLPPLAEIARGLLGDGSAAAALAAAGLEPLVPAAKEGLAMMSANAFSVGWACLATAAAETVLDAFDAAAALSYEGVLANVSVLDPEVAAARPYAGLRLTLERLRELLAGGELLDGAIARELQDPLCFRVVPQTHGAARDALDHVAGQLHTELASAGDNPLLALTGERLISAGNFDSTPIAIALDYARLGVAHAATIANERVQKLLTARFSGLATGLREDDRLADDGLAMLAYSAAAAAGELRLLAAPVSLETPTTSVDEGIDDRVVLSALGSRRLAELVDLALHVAAVELICAAQAVDLRRRADRLGGGTTRIYEAIRELVPFTTAGQTFPPDLAPLEQRLRNGLR